MTYVLNKKLHFKVPVNYKKHTACKDLDMLHEFFYSRRKQGKVWTKCSRRKQQHNPYKELQRRYKGFLCFSTSFAHFIMKVGAWYKYPFKRLVLHVLCILAHWCVYSPHWLRSNQFCMLCWGHMCKTYLYKSSYNRRLRKIDAVYRAKTTYIHVLRTY